MPAAHWSVVTLAAAVAAGLFRRRAAGTADAEAAAAARRVTIEELMSLKATPTSVYGHAYHGCTDGEIAERFRLAEADLRATFAGELTAGRAARVHALRRSQTELATGTTTHGGKPGGHATMLTWLGRNELGQSLSPTAAGQPEPEVE